MGVSMLTRNIGFFSAEEAKADDAEQRGCRGTRQRDEQRRDRTFQCAIEQFGVGAADDALQSARKRCPPANACR